MEVVRIEDGLWRWATPHPEWKPADDWDRDVGCVYWEAEDAVVLIDPLVPTDGDQRTRFLDALDRDVGRIGLPVAILLTCEWHGRSHAELSTRYDARVVGPQIGAWLPQGVRAIDAPVAEEVVYWLGPVHTVVSGDTLVGSVSDGLSLCPASWIQKAGGLTQLRRELAPLLELPVERVLTSHGPSVLADGRVALERALGLVD